MSSHLPVLVLLCAALLGSVLAGTMDRLQYHQQGLKDAPSHVSYRWGYIAGNRDNPQSRHEISPEPGHVSGAYSFVDANNKLQVRRSALFKGANWKL